MELYLQHLHKKLNDIINDSRYTKAVTIAVKPEGLLLDVSFTSLRTKDTIAIQRILNIAELEANLVNASLDFIVSEINSKLTKIL